MRDWAAGLVSAAAFLASMSSPGALAADIDINVNLGHPPPPAIVFEREPRLLVVPRSSVHYVPDLDYDFYRFGDHWFVNRSGYWYRAPSFRGPFRPIIVRDVPAVILGLPVQYRRHPAHPHGGPPGQLKKHGGGHGPHGHGHKGGKGKGKGH